MDPVGSFRAAQERVLERYGVAAESRFLEVPAVEGVVHVLVAGTGPPLILVPGFADPAAMWAPLMGELAATFTIYAVDRPRFGLSGHAALETRSFRRLAVDFLEQVLDALRLDRAVVAGNSMGSRWSSWFALERPARVTRLIHIGCPAFILGTSAPLPMRLLPLPVIGRLLMKLSPPSHKQVEAFARLAGEDLTNMPEMKDLLVAAQRLPGAGDSIRELLRAVITLRGARPEVALDAEELANMQQPVLFIWGERDPFGGIEVAQRAAAATPGARLHIVRGAGHIPWFAHAGEVAAAVRDTFAS